VHVDDHRPPARDDCLVDEAGERSGVGMKPTGEELLVVGWVGAVGAAEGVT
jgi:hypothetical protein